ncbi:MAG: tRNA dihydrouridine synthase DusB [Baileyella intestinalis]|uniref:tRNA dihydrouridine synthase DusB n=1 Tax=Baileyella intestinalis TaxID=2606709 RepID=UPI002A74962A|nr:tRNA dihydrouridine synthase DusB [Baileyella intestinalis]MCI7685893.1 tRNA dihydrouridine synthase DusB [Clostridiales bacterium]MDY2995197.1 tRNA dihydrouridine synthase DusB [Baileyella intestinalis]
MKELYLYGKKLSGPFLLAPLAGVTDAVMRRICFREGASLSYTEMVSAKGLYYGDRKTESLLYIPEDAGPTSIQIFGSDPEIMGYAAEKLAERNNFSLNINMGCPVPKVVRNGDGSALMKDPDLVYDVVRAVADKAGKPVSVKFRKGFDDDHINAVEIAKACEAAGAAAVIVHGRTREQYYSGKADWSIIRQVKEAVDIPVIGNGDVFTGADGVRMMKETGCDLVMVARGAQGNPWIFRELMAAWRGEPEPEKPSASEVRDMMYQHLDQLVELKGEYAAVREMRKHIAWYTKGRKNGASIRKAVNQIESARQMKEAIRFEE